MGNLGGHLKVEVEGKSPIKNDFLDFSLEWLDLLPFIKKDIIREGVCFTLAQWWNSCEYVSVTVGNVTLKLPKLIVYWEWWKWPKSVRSLCKSVWHEKECGWVENPGLKEPFSMVRKERRAHEENSAGAMTAQPQKRSWEQALVEVRRRLASQEGREQKRSRSQ